MLPLCEVNEEKNEQQQEFFQKLEEKNERVIKREAENNALQKQIEFVQIELENVKEKFTLVESDNKNYVDE